MNQILSTVQTNIKKGLIKQSLKQVSDQHVKNIFTNIFGDLRTFPPLVT